MKEKRNCGAPYPVYPQMMVPTMPTPYMTGYNQGYTNNQYNSAEQQISNLDERLTNLESRVSRIENMLNSNNNNNQYNGSNYYMV